MSRNGNCLEFKLDCASGPDNPGDPAKAQTAPMERVLGSLRSAPVHRARFRSRRVAKAELFECIAIFCNRRRLSTMGHRTPEQARIDMTAKMAAE
ncbi:hypothetical protein [Mangrovicoccus ximenensis]|uniref:hypothetical protein n=1 Tax=Mangrovicoccus ximenensis TaxID=1911570 RepID=UPI000D39B6D3|nr:hypothetical protein [Mangrovicoccus ximenensis]